MRIDSGVRRPLRRAATAFAIATAAASGFGPATAQALPDADGLDPASVELLHDALDALSEGDDDGYETLLDQAFDGTVWLPLPALIALDDREVSDIVEWSQVIESNDDDLLGVALDVIEYERDTLGVLDSFAPGQEATREQNEDINDADLDGTGLLEMIDRRGIQIPDSARLMLSPLSTSGDALPESSDYDAALIDLEALIAPVAAEPIADAQPDADPTATFDEQETATTESQRSEPDTDPENSSAVPSAAESTPPTATSGGNGDASPVPLVIAIALGASALAVGLFGAFRNRKTNQLADIAFTDALTGLNNRRRLDADVVAQRARGERTTASLMVDVDHFKQFNDAHGHAMGDEVLRLVGETLGREFRRTDVPYRYGGEEFCILLNDATPAEAHAAGERARAAIEAIQLPNSERVTVSIGVSTGAAAALGDTIQQADRALYGAKQAGRNCVNSAGTKPPEGPEPSQAEHR